jgi:uncharacterized protein YbaR (Trm112 family)|tara:strand:+ start:109 stop:318 length:210 start_codon:yes stop_codon:yes gene_type:complete
MNNLNEIICPNCKTNKRLKLVNKILLCKKCKEAYPIFNGTLVMLTKKNDIFHVKKALLPARYRVEKYGS